MKKKKETYEITLNDIQLVKDKMLEFSQSKEVIHVTYSKKRISLVDDEAVIEGTYNHFCIFKRLSNNDTHTVNYVDIASGELKIAEFKLPFGHNE